MENHFQISGQGPYFLFFYNLAFIVALSILLYEGYKRKFPLLKWTLLLAFGWLFFITGSKLITLSGEDWRFFLETRSIPPIANKNLLGGLIAGLLALLAGKHLFRFKQDISDAFAFALPLAIAIQRVGCFLTGCCHGKPTTLPWAIQYGSGKLAHFHHFESGLISSNDLFSLPVHPVQLYETAGLLLTIILLLRLKSRLKANGSLFLASLILISTLHFLVSFFRDPLAHTTGWVFGSGLSLSQWIILLISPLMLAILIHSERQPKEAHHPGRGKDLGLSMSSLLLFIFLLIVWNLRNWFTSSETLSASLILMLSSFFLGFRFIRGLCPTPVRLVPLTAIAFSLLLMGQTIPENENDSTLVKQFNNLRLGFASGEYFNSHSLGYGEGCERVSYTNYFEQKYTLGGAGLSMTRQNQETGQEMNYGFDFFIGKHTETPLLEYQTKREDLIWGLTPFVRFDFQWFGISGGLHFGDLAYTYENTEKDGNRIPQTGTERIKVYPDFFLRIGPKHIFFTDFHLANHFPSALPGYRYQVGIGSGFGTTKGGFLRTGITGFGSEEHGYLSWLGLAVNGFYLSGYLPLKDRFVIEPMMVFSSDPMEEDAPAMPVTSPGFQFSLGMSYRFGQKTTMVSKPNHKQ